MIGEKNGRLALTFGPTWRGTLDHWHFDTFRTRFDTPVLGAIPVTFRLNSAAKVDEVLIDLAGPVTFRRRPQPPPGSPAPSTPPPPADRH